MLQDSEVSSTSLPERTAYLVLKKTFNIGEDFVKCTEQVANKCPMTIMAHFCSATKTIKTAVGKSGGPLEPSKSYSIGDIMEAMNPHVHRGKYLFTCCRREASIESVKKEITIFYPLTVWVWKRKKEDGIVKEETEVINMEHSPYGPWCAIFAPTIIKNLGRGMDGIIDYIFRNVLIDHSFSLFKENVVESKITHNHVHIGSVKGHVTECGTYSHEPNVAKMIDFGNSKCDGHECDSMIRECGLFENDAWITIHSL